MRATTISSSSYISQSDATLLANQCIYQQIEVGDHCPWNNTTKISETVKFYDFENQVNAYLFRLITNNKKEGYIFVSASYENPNVLAFGYDCNFMLDQAITRYSNNSIDSNEHIIYSGGLTFLRSSNNDQIKNIIANTIEEDSLETLSESYKQSFLKNKNDQAKNNLTQLVNGVQPYGQIIYLQDDLDNIWTNTSANIYTTDQFPQTNNCASTASTNFIYYWSRLRPNPTVGLWGVGVSATTIETRLYNTLYTNIGVPGTMPWNIIPGLSKYSLSCGFGVSGSDERTTVTSMDWAWFTANIQHNIPILFTVALDPKYQQHVMLAVGFQNTSTGDYLRIADGWSHTYSNFYKVLNTDGTRVDCIIDGSYVRW